MHTIEHSEILKIVLKIRKILKLLKILNAKYTL